ncbi:substrate-binding periplasmic protein [Pseudomonas sp. HK3]
MRSLALLSLLCFSLFSYAEHPDSTSTIKREHIKSISVVAPQWKDYTNTDGTGVYWDVIRAIYEPLGIAVKTNNIAWNRAMKMVSKYHTYNAIIGEYINTTETLIFPLYPIDVEYMSLLSKNTQETTFVNMASLSGKKVGWIKDYDVIAKEKRDFELVEFRGIDQGIDFLNSGRIDFLIDDWDEIAAAMKSNNMNTQNYSVDPMPEGKHIYTAFADDQISRELIKIYNERIPVLSKSGALAKIYEKWDNAELPEIIINLSN